MSYANSSTAADVSIGLTLLTNLSSSRLCMNAVGSNQVLNLNPTSAGSGPVNGAGSGPYPTSLHSPGIAIRFNIPGIGQIANNTLNPTLGAKVNSVYMDNLVPSTPAGYEAVLKYSVSESSDSSARLNEKVMFPNLPHMI